MARLSVNFFIQIKFSIYLYSVALSTLECQESCATSKKKKKKQKQNISKNIMSVRKKKWKWKYTRLATSLVTLSHAPSFFSSLLHTHTLRAWFGSCVDTIVRRKNDHTIPQFFFPPSKRHFRHVSSSPSSLGTLHVGFPLYARVSYPLHRVMHLQERVYRSAKIARPAI